MLQGEIIKQLIKDSGLTVTEVARRIDVDRRTIYSYMKSDNLKSETLRQLSVACDKDANYLFKRLLEEDAGGDQIMTEDDAAGYLRASRQNQDYNQLLVEHNILIHKLMVLQEKHIKLHEEYLNFRKSIKA